MEVLFVEHMRGVDVFKSIKNKDNKFSIDPNWTEKIIKKL